MQPKQSVIAGARRALDFGRLAVYKTLELVHSRFDTQSQLSAWVDDVVQSAQHAKRFIVGKTYDAARTFANSCKEEELQISSKSTIVATDFMVAQEIQMQLKSEDIILKAERSAPDLGIDRGILSAGKPRTAQRQVEAARQVQKAFKFSRLGRRTRAAASVVVSRGACAKAAYSDAVFGAAPSHVLA